MRNGGIAGRATEVKGRLAEVPKPLRQLMQRLPVGRSELFLNELTPSNQILFLTRCMEHDRQKKKQQQHQQQDTADTVRGFRFSGKDVHAHGLTRILRPSDVGVKGDGTSAALCTPTSVLDRMETLLQLPQRSSGQLEAYRTPHPNFLRKPHLFFLAVPHRVFEADDGVCGRARLSVEAVLQHHLVQVKRTLYWREKFSPDDDGGGDDVDEEWREDAKMVAADAPDVMLEVIWGCTVAQLRRAAELAAESGYHVFLLGYARQRLMSNEGPMVRELGNLCPSAFRSFQLDVRSVQPPEKSTHSSALLLLEEARCGFVAGRDVAGHSCSDGGRDSGTQSDGSDARMEFALPFAVAEVIVDPKRDALVPWDRVSDSPVAASLFEALYDRRHFCVADAVLHASQRVVLPFLLCEAPPPSSSSSSSGAAAAAAAAATALGVDRGSDCSILPLRLFRWSELYTLLRWRFFASAFGPLSQVVRAEDVAAVGGGLDPFLLPLHEAFVTRVLLPFMRAYHQRCTASSVDAIGRNAGAPGCKHSPSATVDIIDCFSSIISSQKSNMCLSSRQKGKKQQKPQQQVSHSGCGFSESADTCFTLEDLPALVKYLLYFNQHFVVSKSGTSVTFTLPKDELGQ